MKTNKITPLKGTITINNCQLDTKSMVSNMKQILDHSSPLMFNAENQMEFDTNNISMNQINIQKNCINQDHLNQGIIFSKHLSKKIILNHHLCEKIIDSKQLADNCIQTHHLTNKLIKDHHISNNSIKLYHLDPNIGYIFEKFSLERGEMSLDLDSLTSETIHFKKKGTTIWRMKIDSETDQLIFEKNIEGKYQRLFAIPE